MRINELRREYISEGLSEKNLDVSPFKQFEKWLQQAVDAKTDLPDAMTLATATEDGLPSARIVLLRDFDDQGFVFYTDYTSQKGKELFENPRAALVFYWREFDRQVRISGHVRVISRKESRSYFRTRPVASRVASLASKQDEVLPSREILEDRFHQLMKVYHGKEIPLPTYWGGFRLSPDWIEFWQGRPNRLHDRLRYTRQLDGDWRVERLSP